MHSAHMPAAAGRAGRHASSPHASGSSCWCISRPHRAHQQARLLWAQQRQQHQQQRAGVQASSSSSASNQTAPKQLPELWPLDSSYPDSHSFTSFSNWLVPGSVMVGRYPYCEPSRVVDREKGEAQMEKIMGAGITTFVCLQAELPPQVQMELRGIDGFLPYKATAEMIKSALSRPPPSEIVNGLRNPSLDKFLPQRRRPIVANDPEQQAQFDRPSYEINFLHFPVEDLGVPSSAAKLQELVVQLTDLVAKGEKLYIHCWGGRGRAGLVGGCLLREAYGISGEEALARVQKAFDTRLDVGFTSPQTDEQRAYVMSYKPRR